MLNGQLETALNEKDRFQTQFNEISQKYQNLQKVNEEFISNMKNLENKLNQSGQQ